MPVVLYGAEVSPPCRAVLLTAKAIGLDLQLKVVDLLGGKETKSEAFRKMNPAHSVPTLDDNGFHIWESRAIMGYLVNQYAKDDQLYPKDPKKRALVDNMLQFDLGALYASFVPYFFGPIFTKKPVDPVLEAVVKDKLEILDTILSTNAYAAGSKLSIADFGLLCSLSVLPSFKYSLDLYPNIKKWQTKTKSEISFYEEVTKTGSDQFDAFVSQKTNQ